MPKTKASLWVIVATAITVITLFMLPYTPKVTVATTVLERGDLTKTTLLEGVVCYQNEQPCLNLQAGSVKMVYAMQGMPVKAGDLLYSMDTSVEEQALASISQVLFEHEKLRKIQDVSGLLQTVGLQSTMDARKTEAELRASIEVKQIRAAADGVVGNVYTSKGAMVPALSVLGTVRSESKCISALNRLNDKPDVVVNIVAQVQGVSGESLGLASLTTMSAPKLDETSAQYVQQLTFTPTDSVSLTNAEIGERVTVEMIDETAKSVVLVPISAVGSGDRLWVVKDGQASPIQINVSKRNEQYVSVPESLLGERVVLCPDENALYAGCPVKEAKKH